MDDYGLLGPVGERHVLRLVPGAGWGGEVFPIGFLEEVFSLVLVGWKRGGRTNEQG